MLSHLKISKKTHNRKILNVFCIVIIVTVGYMHCGKKYTLLSAYRIHSYTGAMNMPVILGLIQLVRKRYAL